MAFPHCAAVCRVDRGQDADCGAAHVQPGIGCCAFISLSFPMQTYSKSPAATAIGAIPLVCLVLLKNKSGAQIVTKFEPWLYVSHAMRTLGLGNWLSGPLAFAVVALPIYLVGCLGLRVIGVPAILTAIFRPRPEGAVRFLLGMFVVIGVVIALNVQLYASRMDFSIQPN